MIVVWLLSAVGRCSPDRVQLNLVSLLSLTSSKRGENSMSNSIVAPQMTTQLCLQMTLSTAAHGMVVMLFLPELNKCSMFNAAANGSEHEWAFH